MFSHTSIAVLTLAANVVLGVPTWRRSDIPSLQEWKSKNLESYYRFKIRYRHIGCDEVEGTDFYNQCCVPLPKGQPVPQQCIPAACSASTQAPTAPAPASVPPTTEPPAPAPTDGSGDDGDDGNDGEEDCDDSDDSAEDTGDDDSNLPYCDEVSGAYEPVPVTSQYQPQPTNPAPEPTTTAEPEPTTPPTEPEPTTTPTEPEPEPTTPPTEPEPTTTTEPEPTTTAPDNNNGGDNGGDTGVDGQVHTGGIATFYEQDGSEGACGGYHSDDEPIAAMNQGRYGDSSEKSSECGRQVRITNTENNKSVVVTIVDDCPTCPLINSIDLSPSAFQQIADPVEGEVPISWIYLS